MLRLTIAACLSLLLTRALSAQHEHHQSHSDSAFHAMQARGKTAMGVDQYGSTHRFDPLPDGGRIELTSDAGDSVSVTAIRAHFVELARGFRSGDFSTPAFVHLEEEVPGTKIMAERRDRIVYETIELPKGGGLRIRTSDPAAIAAVHEFLAYQRREHRVKS